MKPACFFDVDGTLYAHPFHEVSQETIGALHALKDHEYFLALNTSRSKEELAHVPSSLMNIGFDAYILDGGASIYDRSMHLRSATQIDDQIVSSIATYCEKQQICWRYSSVSGSYWGNSYITSYMKEAYWQLYFLRMDVKPWNGETVFNIMMESNDRSLASDCTITLFPGCMEIRAKQTDKWTGIQQLSSLSPILCFGDGDNDVCMLEKADIGIAMANASLACKQAADVICGSVHESGIATFVKEYLK